MADKRGDLAQFQARKRKLNIWKLVMLGVLLAVVIYFVLSAVKIIELNKEHAQIEEENRELKETVEDLKLQLETIHSDQYMEGLARRQLRLVKPDEILFVLPEIRKAAEGEDSIFKGSTERAAEEAEANRKIQEAMAAQEGHGAGEDQASDETSEQAEGETGDTTEGSGENNG